MTTTGAIRTVGTGGDASYQVRDGMPTVMKDPGIFFLHDKAVRLVLVEMKLDWTRVWPEDNREGNEP